MTRKVLMTVANSRDSTIDQRFLVLRAVSILVSNWGKHNSLAKAIIVMSSFTL